jgi:hypothetical protein
MSRAGVLFFRHVFESGDRYILLNFGISGNCLLYKTEGITSDLFGDPGIIRFDRDVFSWTMFMR